MAASVQLETSCLPFTVRRQSHDTAHELGELLILLGSPPPAVLSRGTGLAFLATQEGHFGPIPFFQTTLIGAVP